MCQWTILIKVDPNSRKYEVSYVAWVNNDRGALAFIINSNDFYKEIRCRDLHYSLNHFVSGVHPPSLAKAEPTRLVEAGSNLQSRNGNVS